MLSAEALWAVYVIIAVIVQSFVLLAAMRAFGSKGRKFDPANVLGCWYAATASAVLWPVTVPLGVVAAILWGVFILAKRQGAESEVIHTPVDKPVDNEEGGKR